VPGTGEFIRGAALSVEQQDAVAEALNTVILPARFAQLEQVLSTNNGAGRGGSTGQYFVGGVLTIADLAAYSLISQILNESYCQGVAPAVVMDGCPCLLRLVERVAAHPAVMEWNTRE
jgi:glutathione S-transferase